MQKRPIPKQIRQKTSRQPEIIRLLLVDFCNVREWNPETLRKLYKQYFISNDIDHPGHFCVTRHAPIKEKFYFDGPDPEKVADEVDQLAKYLERSQNEYREFLDQCIKADSVALLIPFIEKHAYALRGITIGLSPQSDVQFGPDADEKKRHQRDWNLDIELGVNEESRNTVEDWIDLELINIFMKRRGAVFSKIRECPFCKTYFLANRPKQEFCSKKHRLDFHNRKYKLSGKRTKDYIERTERLSEADMKLGAR